jgi:hypothetical protein
MYTLLELQSKTFGELKKIGYELNVLPEGDRRCRQTWIDAIACVNPPLLALLEVSPAGEVPAESPIIETVEAFPAGEVEPVSEPPIESKFGRIVYPRPAQKSIVLAAENSPDVEVGSVQDVIEFQTHEPQDSVSCWQCQGDGFLSDGGVVWDCTHCEGNGLLTLSILEQDSDEVLLFYYGTTRNNQRPRGF